MPLSRSGQLGLLSGFAGEVVAVVRVDHLYVDSPNSRLQALECLVPSDLEESTRAAVFEC